MEGKPYSLELFPDIEGYKINGGTIAANILYTLEIPDLVRIDRTSKKILLLEKHLIQGKLKKNKT